MSKLDPQILAQNGTWRLAVHASQDEVSVNNDGKKWYRRKSYISRKPVRVENVAQLLGFAEDPRYAEKGLIAFTTVFKLKDGRFVFVVAQWNQNTNDWKGKQARAWNFQTLAKEHLNSNAITAMKLEKYL